MSSTVAVACSKPTELRPPDDEPWRLAAKFRGPREDDWRLAYEWIDGSAYLTHVRLVRKARGAEPPPGPGGLA